MSTPVLNPDGSRYVIDIRLKCHVNIAKDGVTEIYHQIKTIRKKKSPELLRDATRKHSLSPMEAKLLVLQDQSNGLTTRQRLKLIQELLWKKN